MPKTKKSIKPKDLFAYGCPKPLINSEQAIRLELKEVGYLKFEVDLLHQPGVPDNIRAWIDCGDCHNCECHKAVALCFFQWTPGGKYKQVPMIDGVPNTNYIMLGSLQEMMKLSD